MPVRNLSDLRKTTENIQLVKELVEEWRHPREDVQEPEILLEHRNGKIGRVYVIWSKWDGMDLEARSEIILDACREVLGEEGMSHVTVAWGIAPDEPSKFGLKRLKFPVDKPART